MNVSTVSNLNTSFQSSACGINERAVKPARKKRMPPLSVRLSPEQRAQIERDAVGMSLNAYVLSRLFEDDGKTKRKQASKEPTKRDKAIARALRRLAGSGITVYLLSQLEAQQEGRLVLSSDELQALRFAHEECLALRRDLMIGLGLNAE